MKFSESDAAKLLSHERMNNSETALHEFILSPETDAAALQMTKICEIAPLHPLTIEDCRKRNQRAKFERYPEYLFVVVHFFFHDLNEICELHLVILDGKFVLIADHPAPQEFASWSECLGLDRGLTLAELIHNTLDACVDSAERRVARLADLVVQAEQLIVGEKFSPKLILELKQQCLRFQRVVIGTLSVVRELIETAEMTVEQSLWFRNVLDHQERLRLELEFLHSEMVALFDVFWGATSFHTNEQIKRLSVLATLGIPLAFWTSFFGMNFEALPFSQNWFFAVAISLMLCSAGVVFLYLKRKGLFRSRAGRASRDLRSIFG